MEYDYYGLVCYRNKIKSKTMDGLKIYICAEFREGPWGGGNQFLKALRGCFRKKECYVEKPVKADVILFNSHHLLGKVTNLKKRFPDKIFVHRVDGPLFNTRGEIGRSTDRKIFLYNNFLADGTIYQSEWSRNKSYQYGLKKNHFETCIMNAPDPSLFYPTERQVINNTYKSKKCKLIATSWSDNPRKGFDLYSFLDNNLDTDRFEMSFIGNSPFQYNTIRHFSPMPSPKLADELRRHDLFITASVSDPCSNSLIEAMHCGLPAVVKNSGGHPEILGKGGELFNGPEDIIRKIEKVSDNLYDYSKNISVPNMNEISQKYYSFCENIYVAAKQGYSDIKKINYFDYIKLRMKTLPD